MKDKFNVSPARPLDNLLILLQPGVKYMTVHNCKENYARAGFIQSLEICKLLVHAVSRPGKSMEG